MTDHVAMAATPLVDERLPAPLFDDQPPGERYYRHPGDVVRLVLWASAALLLVLFVEVATQTSGGLRTDLGRAATSIPRPVRELVLAVVQLGALGVPIAVVVALLGHRRWRRLAIVATAAAAGAGIVVLVDALVDLSATVPGALSDDNWLVSTRFPSLPYVGGAMAALTVGTPWLSRPWRRANDRAALAVVVTVAIAGTAGVPELLLAVAAGALVGSIVLVAVGAPNRRPTAATVAAALLDAGLDVKRLELERAVGGRAQLYRATSSTGSTAYIKVNARDSRDADVLYRGYRRLVLRDAGDSWPAADVERDVEHEALMLLLARRGGVRAPEMRAVATLPDGSAALAMEDVDGRRLDSLSADEIGVELLDGVWDQVASLHRAGLAHRSLRAANMLVDAAGTPVMIDLGAAATSASPRLQAIDRAELLASLATTVGVDRAVEAARRHIDRDALAAAMPFLQPLALSAATRKQVSKRTLADLRTAIGEATGEEPAPLEHLVRVRARTVVLIVTLTGAFYILLPQLANVDDSLEAIRSANWGWLAGSVAASMLTYVGAAVAMMGGVTTRLPPVETMHAQLASSFVNRVTPAKVGGLALNVRYMQKAGVEPAAAVTGMGLNVAVGGVIHLLLLVLFFAWAGQDTGTGFSVPASSKTLVIVVIVLAVVGLVMATRWGRRVTQSHVVPFFRQAFASLAALARSPSRLAALVGGSLCVTLAYIVALACSVAAFDGDLSFAQVGAVYLGASVIAAAAPTPGGLGAVEAALVAGFTALDMDPAIAVAAVLSYRLATFWLPILPGWLSFQLLQRRGFV